MVPSNLEIANVLGTWQSNALQCCGKFGAALVCVSKLIELSETKPRVQLGVGFCGQET